MQGGSTSTQFNKRTLNRNREANAPSGISRGLADYDGFTRFIWCALDLDDNDFMARCSFRSVIFTPIAMTMAQGAG